VRRIGAKVDVTERKRAEDALAERNAQIALAGKAVLVGTYAHDLVTNRIRITEGYAALHGCLKVRPKSHLADGRRACTPTTLHD
jgi:hypothetical protein